MPPPRWQIRAGSEAGARIEMDAVGIGVVGAELEQDTPPAAVRRARREVARMARRYEPLRSRSSALASVRCRFATHEPSIDWRARWLRDDPKDETPSP
jgi:hypothetical protein